jgi:glycosyltransferase involved in cell wall biosynthesis
VKIVFVSNTNKLPNRLITLINYFQKNNEIFLINWQRDAKVLNNFEDIPYVNVQSGKSIAGLLFFYNSVREIIAHNDFDLAYCFDYRMLPVLKIFCRNRKIPLVYDVMEFNSYYIALRFQTYFKHISPFRVQSIVEATEMQLLKLTDGVLVVDSRNDELLRKVRKVQSNCECVMNFPSKYLPVNEKELEEFQKRFDGRKLVVYAGNIFAAKGLYVYLRLVNYLKRVEPSVLLAIVGAFSFGEYREKLDVIIGELGLNEYVEVLPWMKYSSLLALLHNARLGLSLLDPMFLYYKRTSVGNSRKTFTYLQAGVPVLVSLKAVGDFVESHGVGRYVDYEDEEAIFSKAKEILVDDDLFRQMSSRAKEIIQTKCNWENEVPKVERVFAKALAKYK